MVDFLITPGNPAVRGLAVRVRLEGDHPVLQFQNWYTPWMNYDLNPDEYKTLQDIITSLYYLHSESW